MADESTSAISDETKSMLEDQVKKGKARKFILICKGATITTLIVFKKGPYGPKVTQAKKNGFRGEAVLGIVTGKGVNLDFQLPGNADVSSAMKTDGCVYAGEPCKVAKLRGFLADEADLKFKPEFSIITQASAVAAVDESDDDAAPGPGEIPIAPPVSGVVPPPPVAPSPETNDTAPPVPPPPPPSDVIPPAPPPPGADTQKEKLIAVLKNLTPLIQQAVAANPARKSEILTPVASIKQNIQGDNLDEAKQELLVYAPFIKGLAAQSGTVPPVAPPLPGVVPPVSPPPSSEVPPVPPLPGPQDPQEAQWNSLLKSLTPDLKQVLTEKKPGAGEIGALYKKAQTTKPTDITQALEMLKQCAALVEEALGEGAPSESEEDQYKQTWLDVSSEFTSQRAQVSAGLPDQLVEFDQLVQQANALASGEDYFQAVEVAMKLAELDTQARKASANAEVKATIPEHVVEDRKKFLMSRWQEAIKASYQEIDKIAGPIAKEVPDEDPQELIGAITKALDELVDDLNNAILGAQAASSDNMRPLDRALKAVRDYRGKIEGHPLMVQLDQAKSDLGVDVKVSEQLLKALGDVEARLAG